jgi:hypothetical protein
MKSNSRSWREYLVLGRSARAGCGVGDGDNATVKESALSTKA